MSTAEVGNSKLICVSCKKKRKMQVQLTSYQLNSTLGIFMCTTAQCLYPLNSKGLHKFVYKVDSDGKFHSCDPSEVPSLKDLFALLSANANISPSPDTCQEKQIFSLRSPTSSCDIPQVSNELLPKKEKVDIELSDPQAKTNDHIPKEEEVDIELCDPQAKTNDHIPEEEEVDIELSDLQSKTDVHIPKEEEKNQSITDDSESYGAKFGSNKVSVFPIWENKDALCWLDSTLCLLVHSKNLKTYFKSEAFGGCQLKDISIAYEEAVSILNSEKRSSRAIRLPDAPFANLERVRERTFKFLQPFQRCKKGQEDSPVFAIMVLLKQNKYLHNLFLLHFSLGIKCNSCNYSKVSQNKKTLVTIPGVLQDFSDNQLSYLRPCFRCQKPDQKITLKFVKFPPLLLMHFVEGLPHSDISLYDLVFARRGYRVRGFVQYLEPERHFITWVRDDTGDQWMCCDDLNPPVQRFKTKLPDNLASEIHIVMWELKEVNDEDNFHLHHSDDENCNDSLSSIESVSPPLIILDDSDSEAESGKSRKLHQLLNITNDPVVHTNDIKTCGERTCFESSVGEQGTHIQNKSLMTQKDAVDDNSGSGLISGNVPNQIVRETNKSCPSLVNENQFSEFRAGNVKQDESTISESSTLNNVSKNDNKSMDNFPAAKFFSVSNNENQKPEPSISFTDSRSRAVGDDERDKSLSGYCAENVNCLHTKLESDTNAIVSYDICEKNPENKLNLGGCDSPLHEKGKKSSAVGQRNVYIESVVGQCVEQENVYNQNDVYSDLYYDEALCKSIRECYVALDRTVVELHTRKKLLEQNIRQTARRPSLRKSKCAQMTTESNDSSSAAPVKYRERGRKRKPDPLLKQNSFDVGLQDTNNAVEDIKLQADCSSGGLLASVSVVPDEEPVEDQKTNDLLKSSLQSSALGHVSEHSSNLLVPETGSFVFPNKFSVKKEENLAGTSQKTTLEEQQSVVLQNNSSGGSDFLSSGSLSMNQSVTNVMKANLRASCEAMQRVIKYEISDHVPDDLDAKNNAPSEISVISEPVTELKLTKSHGILLTNLNTSSKTENTCGSSLEDKKSSPSADLSNGTNSNIVSSSAVNTFSCDDDCTCDLCSVQRFLKNQECSESKAQDTSCDDEVLGKGDQIPDVGGVTESSETSASVAEQGLNSTVIVQNKSLASSKRTRSAEFSAEDSSTLEKRSSHNRAVHSKMPSRKCTGSRQNVSGKESDQKTSNRLEISQEHKSFDDHLHSKDLNYISRVHEGNDGTVKKSNITMTRLPHMHESCQSIESGHSEQENTVSPSKKHKALVKTGSSSMHLFESTIQENLNQSVGMTSLPAHHGEVCESTDEQVAEQFNKRVKYRRFGRQSKLCVNAENNSEEVNIRHEKSDPSRNSPISRRSKRQEHSGEIASISLPLSNTAMLKKQKCESNKLKSVGPSHTFLSNDSSHDSVALTRKVERKFEPDSVKFVEVPVDSQSSDTESVEGEMCAEMQQAVTVEFNNSTQKKTSSVSGAKKKSSARNVIKYKGITAIFEPFVEDDVSECSSILVSGTPSPHLSRSDASNVIVPSFKLEKQCVVTTSEKHLSTNGIDPAMPVFYSVGLLREHLCSESDDNSEQTISTKKYVAPGTSGNIGQQADVSCSFAKSRRGRKKQPLVQKGDKKGKRKSNDFQVLNSKKASTQVSLKQHRKRGGKDLHCDITILGQTETSGEVNVGCTKQKDRDSELIVKKGQNYLTVVKKMICKHNITSECVENQGELYPSQEFLTASRSPAGNKEITMNMTSETEEKNLTPACPILGHSDATRGILTEKKERKKRDKTVRFNIEQSDSISKPGRKKIKDTSSSELRTCLFQDTVYEKADIRSVTGPQDVGVKKKRNVVGTPVTPRKKIRNESPVSLMQNVDFDESENQGDQFVLDNNTPDVTKVKPGNLSQEAKSIASSKPLGLVSPFLYFPKDLTLNNFNVCVPRPQVRKITSTLKETPSPSHQKLGET